MKFNLLWDKEASGQYIIEDNVFEDLGIFNLIEETISYNYLFLMPSLRQIPEVSTILYRQAIMRDLMLIDDKCLDRIKELLDKLNTNYQKYLDSKTPFIQKVNFLLFIKAYITFIEEAVILLSDYKFTSKALNELKTFVNDESQREDFLLLKDDYHKAYSHFEAMRKFAISRENKYIAVDDLNNKITLENKLLKLADKLKLSLSINQSGSKKNQVSEQFIAPLILLYQDHYQEVTDFYTKYQNFSYELKNLSYDLSYYLFFKAIVLKVCEFGIPLNPVSFNNDVISFQDVCDVTLIYHTKKIIPNDVNLDYDNSIELITGVNSGGKTSYIRSIGVNYFFGQAIGWAFCKEAKLIPMKYIMTHFPNDENFKIGFGRLNEELSRLKVMSEYYTKNTLLILNETFSSTDEMTAFTHTKALLEALIRKNTFCLFVTHQQKIFDYELPREVNVLSPMIDTSNHNERLYKLVKVTDKTSSYTYDILYKYGLTKEQLAKRLEDKEC